MRKWKHNIHIGALSAHFPQIEMTFTNEVKNA